jgi:hypothetical protein
MVVTMAAPKDPVKYQEWIRKNREAHLGKLRGKYNPRYSEEQITYCQQCGKEMRLKPWLSKIRKFCSDDCSRKYHVGEKNQFYGKTHTDSALELNRLKHTGKQYSEITKQKHSVALAGIPRPIDVRERIGSAQRGEKGNNWKGGTTPLTFLIRSSGKYAAWRDSVFVRDDYRDHFSGIRGGTKLHAHHIVPLSVLISRHNIKNLDDALRCDALWDINNGITMQRRSHKAYHDMWGWKH